MKTHSLLAGAVLAAALAAGSAQATITLPVSMNFQSGATFTGTVQFANDYSYVEGVSGVLTGYTFNTSHYIGGDATDSFNWVWADGYNFSSGDYNYSTFLMDGPGSGYVGYTSYSNFIQLAYNYAAAPALTFTFGASYGGTDNFIFFQDPMVSGEFGAPVPEPEGWALMMLGFGSLGALLRANRARKLALA